MASRDGEADKRFRKTSVAWNYFTLIDDEKRIAACNTCDSHMSFRSSISNLMKHLKRKHGDVETIDTNMFEDEKCSDSEGDEGNKVNPEDDKLQSPTIREHFEITNAEKKVATCSVCQVPLSYKSSVSALLKHLRRKHNVDVGDVETSEDEEKKAESPPPNLRSNLWPYFRITDPASKAARCLVCKKLLSYKTGTSNLRKHLMRKHPLINLPAPGEERKTIILSSGDQLYEYEVEAEGENKEENEDNDQSEPVAIDEVFLDEFNGSINRIETDKKYKSKKRKHKEKKTIILENSDSDDEVLQNKCKKEDSIDLFGKYIASLLKELPKQTSNRLQKDFVQQIMNAQNECQRYAQNNGYSITIADAGETVPEDVRFEVITTKLENKYESDTQDDVWSFFERAGGEARCAVCRAMVPISALRSHLRNNHPKLVDIVESEDETANNTQEDVYTEVVYLEHEDSPKRAKPIEKPRKLKKYIEKTPIKRRVSTSSDEEPLQHKKIRNEDEIEQFGKYVTCLLKKIPQETSMELQMDIVSLIMKRQLELKRNETSVLAGSKMAAVQTEGQAPSFEIKIRDEKTMSNGYSYSIQKIVNEETVESNE